MRNGRWTPDDDGSEIPALIPLDWEPGDIHQYDGVLWRLYKSSGPYPQRWNEYRYYGPLPESRFDPQVPPEGEGDSDRGVIYASADPLSPFAEVYQGDRVIRPDEDGVTLVAWQPTGPVRVLDLRGDFVYRNGGLLEEMHDVVSVTQQWARKIFAEAEDWMHGVVYTGATTGTATYALFNRAGAPNSMPGEPVFHARLTDPTAQVFILDAIDRLNLRSA